MDTDVNSETRSIFIVGLRNANAMENQALSIMKPQVKRIENYPQVADRLQQYIQETEGQIARLESIWTALMRTIRPPRTQPCRWSVAWRRWDIP